MVACAAKHATEHCRTRWDKPSSGSGSSTGQVVIADNRLILPPPPSTPLITLCNSAIARLIWSPGDDTGLPAAGTASEGQAATKPSATHAATTMDAGGSCSSLMSDMKLRMRRFCAAVSCVEFNDDRDYNRQSNSSSCTTLTAKHNLHSFNCHPHIHHIDISFQIQLQRQLLQLLNYAAWRRIGCIVIVALFPQLQRV